MNKLVEAILTGILFVIAVCLALLLGLAVEERIRGNGNQAVPAPTKNALIWRM